MNCAERTFMGKQATLKPQDLLVALKMVVNPQREFTYAELASELFMSASEVHASTRRAELSRLLGRPDKGITPIRSALLEFLIHGVKFVFPAVTGPLARGMPTGVGGPVLSQLFAQGDPLVPVWPDPEGSVRGMTICPIYPSVPAACRIDGKLYELLTLLDAIRGGAARERALAGKVLLERLG
jgi:hypothetical protein